MAISRQGKVTTIQVGKCCSYFVIVDRPTNRFEATLRPANSPQGSQAALADMLSPRKMNWHGGCKSCWWAGPISYFAWKAGDIEYLRDSHSARGSDSQRNSDPSRTPTMLVVWSMPSTSETGISLHLHRRTHLATAWTLLSSRKQAITLEDPTNWALACVLEQA